MRKRESADSCTTILVGKNASYDGSTIVARTKRFSKWRFFYA